MSYDALGDKLTNINFKCIPILFVYNYTELKFKLHSPFCLPVSSIIAHTYRSHITTVLVVKTISSGGFDFMDS